MSKHFPVHIVAQETWVRNRGTKAEVSVTKSAVRVQKGVTGVNRPGTFQGATNFRGSERNA